MSDLHVLPAVVLGVVGLPFGALVPALIARIPELEDEPVEEGEEPPAQPDIPFGDVAARPGLAWKTALTTGLSAAVLGLCLGWAWPLLFLVPLVPICVALAVVDWHTRILPTWLIAPTYGVTIALVLLAWLLQSLHDGHWQGHDLLHALLAWLAFGGGFFVFWFIYPPGMGYGDVRLAGVIAIALGYLGWNEAISGFFVGLMLNGVIGVVLLLFGKVERKGSPMGPFLVVGALVGVVLGQLVLNVPAT